MIDLEYHKGQKCIYGSTFCQEGFCSACNLQLSHTMETVFSSSMTIQRITSQKRNSEFVRAGSLQPI
jgi:hypothetical protein